MAAHNGEAIRMGNHYFWQLQGMIVVGALILTACGSPESTPRAEADRATYQRDAPPTNERPTSTATIQRSTALPPRSTATIPPQQAAAQTSPDPTILPTAAPLSATKDSTATSQPARTAARFADVPIPTHTALPTPQAACPRGCQMQQPGCLIKGTIPAVDVKVYLLPNQPGYATARIEPGKGERWFCRVNEALAAGWGPSKIPLPARRP